MNLTPLPGPEIPEMPHRVHHAAVGVAGAMAAIGSVIVSFLPHIETGFRFLNLILGTVVIVMTIRNQRRKRR